jgi:hypothetical protein
MLSAVRQQWDRARRPQLEVKWVLGEDAGAQTTFAPIGVGAFAALLIEWKLAQQRASDSETQAEQPTLKSA